MINENDITNALEEMGGRLTMTDAENARVASVLNEHMAYNPIAAKQPTLGTPSPYTSVGLWLGRIAVVGAITLVITGSGLIAAADQSLPGDSLYGFKVGINEEIKSFLKPSPAARLAFEVSLTKERLNEAQTLIARGDFNVEAQQTIEKSIQKHSQEITRHAQDLATENPKDFEEITQKAQTSIAQKAKEVEATVQVAATASVADNSDTQSLLAALTVTEQAVKPLDDIAVAIAVKAQEQLDMDPVTTTVATVATVIDEQPLTHSQNYLSYVMDDLTSRAAQLKIETDAPVTEVAEAKAKTPDTTLVVDKDTVTKESQENTVTVSIETEKAEVLKKQEEVAKEEAFDVSLFIKKVAETQSIYEKINTVRGNEGREERLLVLTELFLESAEEAYLVVQATLPSPTDIAPKTNGVIILAPEEIQNAPALKEVSTSPDSFSQVPAQSDSSKDQTPS